MTNASTRSPRSAWLQSTPTQALGLGVEFVQLADRWSHRIVLRLPNGQNVDLLHSIEGTAHDRWPSSPAFQELVFDQGRIADQPTAPRDPAIAQLLGQAGRNFWSASFELTPQPAMLNVDIACRAALPAEFLGSTYRIAGGLEEVSRLAVGSISLANGQVQLTATHGAIHWNLDARDRLMLTPDENPADVQTHRWSARIEVAHDRP